MAPPTDLISDYPPNIRESFDTLLSEYTPEEEDAFELLFPLCERYLDLVDAKDGHGLRVLYEETKKLRPVATRISNLAGGACRKFGGFDEEEALFKRYETLFAAKDGKGLHALCEEARTIRPGGRRVAFLAGGAWRKFGLGGRRRQGGGKDGQGRIVEGGDIKKPDGDEYTGDLANKGLDGTTSKNFGGFDFRKEQDVEEIKSEKDRAIEEALHKRYIDLLAAEDGKGLRILWGEAKKFALVDSKIAYLAGRACRKFGGFDDFDKRRGINGRQDYINKGQQEHGGEGEIKEGEGTGDEVQKERFRPKGRRGPEHGRGPLAGHSRDESQTIHAYATSKMPESVLKSEDVNCLPPHMRAIMKGRQSLEDAKILKELALSVSYYSLSDSE